LAIVVELEMELVWGLKRRYAYLIPLHAVIYRVGAVSGLSSQAGEQAMVYEIRFETARKTMNYMRVSRHRFSGSIKVLSGKIDSSTNAERWNLGPIYMTHIYTSRGNEFSQMITCLLFLKLLHLLGQTS
jgi:hypothetical protein